MSKLLDFLWTSKCDLDGLRRNMSNANRDKYVECIGNEAKFMYCVFALPMLVIILIFLIYLGRNERLATGSTSLVTPILLIGGLIVLGALDAWVIRPKIAQMSYDALRPEVQAVL